MMFLQRTRRGHRHSDQRQNCFTGNTEETSERLVGAYTGFSESVDPE